MKFRTVRFVNARFAVAPDYYSYHQVAGQSIRTKNIGVHVNFVNGLFDSVEAQRREKWSDETREMVENWLLNHEEYGVNFVRDASEQTIKPSATTGYCDFLLISENGTQMCGLPVTEGTRCGQHQEEMATA